MLSNTKRREKILNINRTHCSNCKNNNYLCSKLTETEDMFIGKISLWGRAIYNLIAWFILANNIQEGTSTFMAIFLTFSPLCFDYIKFRPVGNLFRTIIKWLGFSFSIIWICIAILGLGNIFYILKINNCFVIIFGNNFLLHSKNGINFINIWKTMFISVALTFIDIFANITEFEKALSTSHSMES